MQLTMLLAVSSSLLSACASVPRPNTDVCIANVQVLHEKCYNMERDFTDDDQLKKDAKPHFLPCPGPELCLDPKTAYKDEAAMLAAIHKKTTIDIDGSANLKAYLKELRRAAGRRGD